MIIEFGLAGADKAPALTFKRYTMTKQLCPKCSGDLKLVSGFKRCGKCGYVLNSQDLNTDWKLQDENGFKKAKLADDQARPDNTHAPKGRNPLRF